MKFNEFVNRNKNVAQNFSARKISSKIEISEERNAFYNGDLFKKYDIVESEGIQYTILEQASNYYNVVDSTGNISRKFAKHITKISHDNSAVVNNKFHGYEIVSEEAVAYLKENYSAECDDIGILKKVKQLDEQMSTYTSKDKLTVAKIIADAVGIKHDAISDPSNLVNAAIRKAKKDPSLMKNKEILQNMLQIARDVGIKFNDTTFEMTESFDAKAFERHMEKLKANSKKSPMEQLVAKLHSDDAHKKSLRINPNVDSTRSADAYDTNNPYGHNYIGANHRNESEAPLKHHSVMVSYHKKTDPHRRYEARYKTTHSAGKEETEKRAKSAFEAKGRVVYNMVHESEELIETHLSVGDAIWAKHPTDKTKTLTGNISSVGRTGYHVKHKDGTKAWYPHADVSADYPRENPYRKKGQLTIESEQLTIESEQLEELSSNTLKTYSQLAKSSASKLVQQGSKSKNLENSYAKMSKASKRLSNVAKADKKSFSKDWKEKTGQNESVEQPEELKTSMTYTEMMKLYKPEVEAEAHELPHGHNFGHTSDGHRKQLIRKLRGS